MNGNVTLSVRSILVTALVLLGLAGGLPAGRVGIGGDAGRRR